uniref:Uncharacterized protein n=1 Tax=Rhizophagus irregularis (strain DAOM 181602 / DAOM 197198 / MUCL 43194) TaxID=747089 RepID=U9TMD8_RHIID
MYTLNSKISSGVDTDITGNRLQRGRRYSRNSAPAWTPIFQLSFETKEFGSNVDADIPEFGSGVDTDIPGIRLQRGRRYSR